MRRTLPWGLFALFWCPVAWAGGYAIDEQDAAATGRGGTAGARSEVSSIYYNPAGLAGLASLQAEVGATGIAPSATATDPAGRSTSTQGALFVPPYAYLGGALGKLGLGLSFNAPFGLGVSWPAGFEDRYEVQAVTFQSFAVMAGAAYRIAGPLSIGLSAGAVNTRIDIAKALDFATQDGSAHLEGSGWGFAAGGGLRYEVGDLLALGLSGFIPTHTAMAGVVRFTGVPTSFGPLTQDQAMATQLTLPARLRLGGSLHPVQPIRIDLDLEYTFWSAFKSFDVTFANPSPPESSEEKDWSNTFTARLGGEYSLLSESGWTQGLTARAGLVFDGQAAPANTLGPDSPDGPRFQVAVGVGKAFGAGLRADLAYSFILLGATTSTDPNFPARYQGHAHALGLSLGWAWGAP